MRFLKARDWDVDEAEKLLKATVEWRRTYQPLHVDCSWCHEKPGFHSVVCSQLHYQINIISPIVKYNTFTPVQIVQISLRIVGSGLLIS